jgi:hypothetical protein
MTITIKNQKSAHLDHLYTTRGNSHLMMSWSKSARSMRTDAGEITLPGNHS